MNATVEVAPTATTNCECKEEWYDQCDFGHDGKPRWVYDARERVSASPRMYDGKVLIVCRDGTAILLSR